MNLLFLQSSTTPWYSDAISLATIVIAVSTTVYVIATILLWRETRDNVRITRETFENSLRPYIGIPELSVQNLTDHRTMVFTARVENFGSVPALEVKTLATMIADGFALDVQKHETGFLLIPPHSFIYSIVTVDGAEYDRAVAARVNFGFSVDYEGIGDKKYKYEFEGVYYPNRDAFVPTSAKSSVV